MASLKRTTPASRSQADARERILRTAEALFMHRGFASTRLRMITARAKVDLAAVNYHFGSKEAVIRLVPFLTAGLQGPVTPVSLKAVASGSRRSRSNGGAVARTAA